MTTFARAVLLFIWLLLFLILLVAWILALMGDMELALDMFELPLDLPAPPSWAIAICFSLTMITLSSLGWAFLNMSRMLGKTHAHQFWHLAVKLKQAAWGFIGFWAGSVVIWRAVPALLSINAEDMDFWLIDWMPIDIELILLAVAIVFLALSKSLLRAQEIEDDNSKIV